MDMILSFKRITESVTSVVASGEQKVGAFYEAIKYGGADAVLAASDFTMVR